MRKPKMSEDERLAILQAFHTNTPASRIAAEYGRDYTTIIDVWQRVYSAEAIILRGNRMKGLAKLGEKNPMHGKQGMAHHNAKMYNTTTGGYVEVWAPDWYTGNTDGGKALLHILVYCEHNDMFCIPPSMVVHHIDCDRSNNDISNLVLLSQADHFKVHQFIRKVQRLSQ